MKNKEFDCVEMKNEIQRRLEDETRGMTLQERNAFYERKILADPVLARLWNRAERVSNSGLVSKP